MQRIMLIVMLTSIISGCSNPQDANEENFTKALNEYGTHLFEKGSYCIGKGPYPLSQSIRIIYYKVLDNSYSTLLEQVGLIKNTGTKKVKREKYITYDLTKKGKKYFQEGKGFCYGKPVVVRINNFTPPQNIRSKTVSKVYYEYKYIDVPEWVHDISKKTADSNKTYSAIRDVAKTTNNPKKYEALLVLTNNGWLHQKLLGQ